MLCVRLITDPFDLDAYSEHHPTVPLVKFLTTQFDAWPTTARLYRDSIAVANDVTPNTEADAALLEATDDGLFYVVVYPGDPITAIITVVVTLALTAAVLLFMTPKLPGGTDTESANNALGNRSNKARPNERIPEIFGGVIAIPELLAVPLLLFEDNLEVEYCYMCVGRGAYDISAVRDGDTPLAFIAGAGAEFYAPFTSPNSGSPQLTIGTAITEPLRDLIKLNEVNGQKLDPPNHNSVTGTGSIRFVAPNFIQNNGSIDFTDYFGPGDDITVADANFGGAEVFAYQTLNAKFTSAREVIFSSFDTSGLLIGSTLQLSGVVIYIDDGVNPPYTTDLSGSYTVTDVTGPLVELTASSGTYDPFYDPNGGGTIYLPYSPADWSVLAALPGGETEYGDYGFGISSTQSVNFNGVYPVTDVSPTFITLAAPEDVNPVWDTLTGETAYASPTLWTEGEAWAGWFLVDMPQAQQIIINLYCPQGLYATTGKGEMRPFGVTTEFAVQAVDADDAPVGSPTLTAFGLHGEGTDKNARGGTLKITLPAPGRYRVRGRRTSPKLTGDSTWVDEVKWRDCYGAALVTTEHFGDVTTVVTRTYATSGATGTKERKLNCRAVRKVLTRNMDNTFGPTLTASTNAADIICHMALDPLIGGRTLAELDVEQIYGTLSDVADYFGIDEATSFGYTFDQSAISFEEMVQTVAQAVFCTAYRQASLLRLHFERATEDSTLLFNHRNKVPRSEKRTVRFGSLNGYDGVELDYVSPRDGAKLTIYIPEDQTATKPKKIDMSGVQDDAVAFLHAARAYNKIRYSNVTTEFTALSEGTQLVLSERIEVTDNTRPDVFDGHIVSQDGLALELSQPFESVDGTDYIIFIQLPIGKTQVIDITPGADEYHVVLQETPEVALVIGPEIWADTVYQIVAAADNMRPTAFLLTEKGAYDRETVGLQAINYDMRYYQDDATYLP